MSCPCAEQQKKWQPWAGWPLAERMSGEGGCPVLRSVWAGEELSGSLPGQFEEDTGNSCSSLKDDQLVPHYLQGKVSEPASFSDLPSH